MAAGGKGKSRGKNKKAFQEAASRRQKPRNHAEADFSKSSHTFSLQQEALNTDRNSLWRSNLRLRDNKVTFVPADNLTGDSGDESIDVMVEADGQHPSQLAAHLLKSTSTNENVAELDVEEEEPHLRPSTPVRSQDIIEDPPLTEPLFFVDRSAAQLKRGTGLRDPITRTSSPSCSDSGSDVVVFQGRNSSVPTKPQQTPSSRVVSINDHLLGTRAGLELKQLTLNAQPQEINVSKGQNARALTPALSGRQSSLLRDTDNSQKNMKKSGLPSTKLRRLEHAEEEAAILADYIEHMAKDTSSEGDSDINPADDSDIAVSWDSENLADLDLLSTSDDLPDEVGRVISKRQRQNGIQYLITAVGESMDLARWIPSEQLVVTSATKQISNYEKRKRLSAQVEEMDESSSEDSDGIAESSPEGSSHDSELDESEFLQRRKDKMTDEEIARALNKQELFGMPTEELLLFDGLGQDDDFEDDLEDDLLWTEASYNKRGRKSRKRGKGHFPDASALADVLEQFSDEGFNIMDWDRPSLRSDKDKRREPQAFSLSDSDLEAVLQQSWETDRQKKKARKQEREQLRSLGLLGRAGSGPDLKLKYPQGMTLQELTAEIRSFLLSTSDSLALPPMDSKTRKTVHELANAVSLKSKSRGSGTSRFTVLIKTSRTAHYSETSVFHAEKLLQSRRKNFLPRMGKLGPRGSDATRSKRPRGGGSILSGASYMDGEIVGASAPEIGSENKGRSMLEKMGWSKGTALGALHNKGILTPVEHRVKSTKAGLG